MSPLLALLTFALGAHAAVHALLPHAPDAVRPTLIAFAACALAGAFFGPAVDGLLRSSALGRRISLVWPALGAAFLLGLGASVGVIDGLLGSWVQALCVAHGALLLAGGGALGRPAMHQSAFALVAAAVITGGPLAVGAAAGYAALLVLWLSVHHHETCGVRARYGLAAGLGRAALAGAAVGVPLAWAPPEAVLPLVRTGAMAPEAGELVRRYVDVLPLAGGLLLLMTGGFVVVRLFWPEDDEGEAVESAHVARVELRAAPQGVVPDLGAAPAGPRGRLVRLYLRFLRRAARLGVARPAGTTPSELAARLPAAATPLTRAFERARWGEGPITSADFRAARADAEVALAELAARGPRGRA